MIINSKNTYGTKAIAKDKIIGKSKDKDKQNYLNLTKTLKRRETYGLDVLDLKIDIRYMLTININTHDGLFNGATGILRKIDFDDNNNPKTVYIEFDNSHVGAETRKKNNEQFTPIFLCTKLFQYKNKIDVKISRTQFPLIAAEGITIHKSQGSTYTMIVVHLDRKTKLTRAALYVACSRVTTINGLFFIGIFEPPNSIENAIELNNEISLLRTSKLLIPVFNNMISKSNSLKLLFHNIQSINAHFTDIQSDQNQMNMDLIFLVETWSLSGDDLKIPNFEIINRIDCSNRNTRKATGLINYVNSKLKDDIKCINTYYHESHGSLCISMEKLKVDYLIITLYKSPNYPETELYKKFQEMFDFAKNNQFKYILICGDFNIDLKNKKKSAIEKLFVSKNLYNALNEESSTTKGKTCIDWAFTNIPKSSISTLVYPVTYSYHNAIFMDIN